MSEWIRKSKKVGLFLTEMRFSGDIEYLLCQLWVNSMKFSGVTEQESFLPGGLMQCSRT